MNEPKDFSSYSNLVQRIAKEETEKYLKDYQANLGEPFNLMKTVITVSSFINETYMGPPFPYQAIESYMHRFYVIIHGENGIRYFNPNPLHKTN